jgi:hypothetical protein
MHRRLCEVYRLNDLKARLQITDSIASHVTQGKVVFGSARESCDSHLFVAAAGTAEFLLKHDYAA